MRVKIGEICSKCADAHSRRSKLLNGLHQSFCSAHFRILPPLGYCLIEKPLDQRSQFHHRWWLPTPVLRQRTLEQLGGTCYEHQPITAADATFPKSFFRADFTKYESSPFVLGAFRARALKAKPSQVNTLPKAMSQAKDKACETKAVLFRSVFKVHAKPTPESRIGAV